MSEILLSLTIIGVVAAITLPSLTGNINERVWNTQRKALYTRMSQAIALMPSLNGYGIGATDTETASNAAQAFVADGLSKVLKINNICDTSHLSDCGIPDNIQPISGSKLPTPKTILELNNKFSGSFDTTGYADHHPNNIAIYRQIDTQAGAFETANGESILTFYNPYCSGDKFTKDAHWSQPLMCANFIYDLNGKKGPNAVGKDIGFITALYPTDSVVVMPMPIRNVTGSDTTYAESINKCHQLAPDSRVPSKEEIASMFYNNILVRKIDIPYAWSNTKLEKNNTPHAWLIYYTTGRFLPYGTNSSGYRAFIRCIKR